MFSYALFHFCLFFPQNERTCFCSDTFAEAHKVIRKILLKRCMFADSSSVPYFGQNYIALLTIWRPWWRTHHAFWKMFYCSKGTSNIFILYLTHGSDRFGLWYIIFLTSEVLLLGLQDQYGIFPGPKFRYSWWYLNEQKWKSHRQLFS